MHYSVLGYRIVLYFHDHKLARKVDENCYKDGKINYEVDIQKAVEMQLGLVFIRINNPDEQNFNIFNAINKIHRHNEKSSKKSLLENLLKTLLELKFASNHSIKSKTLKHAVEKYCLRNKPC